MFDSFFPRTVVMIYKGFYDHNVLILFSHTTLINFLSDYTQRWLS